MTTQRDETFDTPLIGSLAIDAAIRIGLLGLFLYWSLKVIGPFLTIALWSAILTVALYPLFVWLAVHLGSRRLAATLITLLCLVIVIGHVKSRRKLTAATRRRVNPRKKPLYIVRGACKKWV